MASERESRREQELLESLRRGWQRREAEAKERERKRRELALDKAQKAALHLKEKYGVREVYLFGSLAYGLHFSERSDIDLLVEGFPTEANYWLALAELEEIAIPFPVNVILSEDAFPSLREVARAQGIRLV